MKRPAFGDIRFWLLLLAFLLVVASLTLPHVPITRTAYDAIAIVDITSSMNTRDQNIAGEPVSRLDAIKDRLRQFVAKLPCQSQLGLGIFTERRSFVLFTPVEVCANYASIEASISGLDWRMAWEGDSHIATGVYRAIELAGELGVDLIFLTDGHEAPPLHWTGMPEFEGKPGDVRGLLVGVGGKTLSPLLKYDNDGREIGVMAFEEVQQENRSGRPPPDAESRPGYHPKWAPYGAAFEEGTEHLTSVKEDHLRAIAAKTGLHYAHLTTASALAADFEAIGAPREVRVATDVSQYPAGLALLLLLAVFVGLPLRDIDRRRRAPNFNASPPRAVRHHAVRGAAREPAHV